MAKMNKETFNVTKKEEMSWHDHFKLEMKAVEKLMQVSDNLQEGELVGAVLLFPVGDGNAMYLVTKERPLTLQWVQVGDNWSISEAHVRGLRKKDVMKQLSSRKALGKLFG